MYLVDPEKPELEVIQMDDEDRCSPETYTCNGSGSRKTCKHQSKREQLEREKEQLRRQEESPNQQEEVQDSRAEGKSSIMFVHPYGEYYTLQRTGEGLKDGNPLRTSTGQVG